MIPSSYFRYKIKCTYKYSKNVVLFPEHLPKFPLKEQTTFICVEKKT